MSRSVSVERVVRATPQKVFDLLADPARHPDLDGSGTVKASGSGPTRLAAGAKFSMSMRIGLPYRITNTVVEFEEGRRIAWRHFGGQTWRYELEPVDGGTRVVETFDWGTARYPPAIEWFGFPDRNRRGMEATLERLAQQVSA